MATTLPPFSQVVRMKWYIAPKKGGSVPPIELPGEELKVGLLWAPIDLLSEQMNNQPMYLLQKAA